MDNLKWSMVYCPWFISGNKKPPVVRAAFAFTQVCYFFTLTVAILTETRSLIIRTTITMTIRERLKS